MYADRPSLVKNPIFLLARAFDAVSAEVPHHCVLIDILRVGMAEAIVDIIVNSDDFVGQFAIE